MLLAWATFLGTVLAVVPLVFYFIDRTDPGDFTVTELSADTSEDVAIAIRPGGDTNEDTAPAKGKAPAAVLAIVLKNNSDDLRNFTVIGVRTKAEVVVSDCQNGGGSTEFTGAFEVQAPPLGKKAETPMAHGYHVGSKEEEGLLLTIGGRPHDIAAGGIVLGLEVFLVEDNGKTFEVGRIAVPADTEVAGSYTSDTALVPVGSAPDPSCVRKIADELDKLEKDGFRLSKVVREVRDGARSTADALR